MMIIKDIPITDIKEYENNPRKNEKAVEPVKRSIKDYGFKVPIIVDANNVIIAGHTRLKAAEKLGLETVPCIVASDLSDEQVKALRLADNKVAQLSTWDMEKLEAELDGLDGADWVKELFAKTERSVKKAENIELDIDDFSDEVFEYECPCCGFKFNK